MIFGWKVTMICQFKKKSFSKEFGRTDTFNYSNEIRMVYRMSNTDMQTKIMKIIGALEVDSDSQIVKRYHQQILSWKLESMFTTMFIKK